MSERQRLAKQLRTCSKNLLFHQGLQVHGAVVNMGLGFDLIMNNDLIGMYGKCSRMDLACAVFDRMLERNVVSWTALMCGYLHEGNAKGSLALLSEMRYSGVKPNEFTFSTSLKACGFLGVVENGMQIHGMCVRSGFGWFPVVGNATIDMYSKCRRISMAEQLFYEMPFRNLVSWNAMISGHTHEGNGKKSLILFQRMQEQGEVPDEFTFTSTLKACSALGAIQGGTQIHASLITRGFAISNSNVIAGAIVDLYAKCGYLCEAQKVFDQIEQKNVITWSTIIRGFAQEGKLLEAMDLFRQLRKSVSKVDGFVLSIMVGVFADLALVEQGKQIHCYTFKVPSGFDISVANSIIDMYLKCGLTEEAERLFSEMQVRNVVSWTVMITGYGKHGLGEKAIHLFDKMQLDGIEPDEVAYLALLSACSHSGLVAESQGYFSRLCNNHQMKTNVEHYACMVDILGRAGQLEEAKNLILNMKLAPNEGIWQTLLSACRVHGNLEIGREVGEILFRMGTNNPVNYVMMSNIYAEAGYWKECATVRKLFKAKGLKKEAGKSWVEIGKKVHFFYGGDETHPLTEKIHEVLKEMERRVKEEIGYAHGLRFALHDVEEESKEENLRVHSEKLAIGLVLVCDGMERGGVIRVFKNLRVCGDCHEFIKGLSKILEKVFIVRDANRFHKFEDGSCSCKDYW